MAINKQHVWSYYIVVIGYIGSSFKDTYNVVSNNGQTPSDQDPDKRTQIKGNLIRKQFCRTRSTLFYFMSRTRYQWGLHIKGTALFKTTILIFSLSLLFVIFSLPNIWFRNYNSKTPGYALIFFIRYHIHIGTHLW